MLISVSRAESSSRAKNKRLWEFTQQASKPARPQRTKEGLLTKVPSAASFSSVWGWARGSEGRKVRGDSVGNEVSIGQG